VLAGGDPLLALGLLLGLLADLFPLVMVELHGGASCTLLCGATARHCHKRDSAGSCARAGTPARRDWLRANRLRGRLKLQLPQCFALAAPRLCAGSLAYPTVTLKLLPT
jgi:hypothetical protein